MGEYAKRKSDGVEIKIGTCEEMYYLRFEDRFKVQKIANSLDPVREAAQLRFRLPFPDENDILPGDYKNYNRGERLYRQCGVGSSSYCEDFKDESKLTEPGSFQMYHKESGLLLSVPCLHGMALPNMGEIKPCWNGKGWSFELASLRGVEVDGNIEVRPVVRCRHCRAQWRYDWADIWEYVPMPLRMNLRIYAEVPVNA